MRPDLSSRSSHYSRTCQTLFARIRITGIGVRPSFMDGSPCTTNSRLLAARLSSAFEARSAPIAQPETTAPATRPRDAAYSHRLHRTRRMQDRANTTHTAAATGMAISKARRRGARSPQQRIGAMLSTKPQLAHKPAQRAIVHGINGRGGITCSRSVALIRRCNL